MASFASPSMTRNDPGDATGPLAHGGRSIFTRSVISFSTRVLGSFNSVRHVSTARESVSTTCFKETGPTVEGSARHRDTSSRHPSMASSSSPIAAFFVTITRSSYRRSAPAGLAASTSARLRAPSCHRS